ncbi:MAG: hypothetical protein V7765_00265 [Oleispira sp.]
MIIKNSISFFKDFECSIKFKIKGIEEEIFSNLIVNNGGLARLKSESGGLRYIINGMPLSENEKERFSGRSNSKRYVFVDCGVSGPYIYPNYIIEGVEEESYTGIEVSLTGFSSWFDTDTSYEITDTGFKKDLPDKSFDEVVNIDGCKYRISSNGCVDVENIKARDFLVSEYTTIKILKVNGTISEADAKKLANDMRKLFSLLLGYPLALEYVWLLVETTHIRRPLYFPAQGSDKDPFDNKIDCIISSSYLHSNDGWKKIFKNYYSNPTQGRFHKIWGVLPTLFDYNGIWEYELLGYISVLDAYTDKVSKKYRKKLDEDVYAQLISKLTGVIDIFHKEIGADYDEIISSFKNGVGGIKNTNLPTFREKFNSVFSGENKNILDILDFDNDDFSALLKIRNSAAHGNPVATKSDFDLNFECRLNSKLKSILFYLVYLDFGFTSMEFFEFISRTFNRTIKGAGVSEYKLDGILGCEDFYEFCDLDLLEVSKTNKINIAVEVDEESGIYKFNRQITDEIWKWMSSIEKEHSNMEDHVQAFLNASGSNRVKYIARSYVFCGEKHIQINGMCLITFEKELEKTL